MKLLVTTRHFKQIVYHCQSFRFVFMSIMILFLSVISYAQTVDNPICFKKKFASIHEIIILPVNFDSYFLTSGGIREYNHFLTTQSRKAIMEAVSKNLLEKSYKITTLSEESYMEKCWRPLRHFYSVINNEILSNVYGNFPFPNPVKTFAYSLPPIPDSLLYPTTDAILFVDGFDDCSTPRRMGRKGSAAVVSAISVASVILGGPGVFLSVPPDQTAATCALVNRDGAIVWYYRHSATGRIDMTSQKSVEAFFFSLLRNLSKEASN